jgi:hypothetical protein
MHGIDMKTDTERACELRAEGLREIVDALQVALRDWQELQERAEAEGLDVTAPAQDVRVSLDKAARLVAEAV